MPSPVPSSVTVVRSLGTKESFHARARGGRLGLAARLEASQTLTAPVNVRHQFEAAVNASRFG
jgi:hypothetical protein